MQSRAKAVSHLFMPGDTVGGIIKKYNRHDVTKDEMRVLLKTFMDVNGNDNPRACSRKLIPVLERHHEAVFKG
jgi:hypothetical protein